MNEALALTKFESKTIYAQGFIVTAAGARVQFNTVSHTASKVIVRVTASRNTVVQVGEILAVPVSRITGWMGAEFTR